MSASCVLRRLWSRVEKENGHDCWIWTGGLTVDGYGQIGSEAGRTYPHHITYEVFVGDRPGGNRETLNHICGNRSCCNPDHLELIPHSENINAPEYVGDFSTDCGIRTCYRCIMEHRDGVLPKIERRPGGVCEVDGCGERSRARSLCGKHYSRWLKNRTQAATA